jgi:hypothetical protein
MPSAEDQDPVEAVGANRTQRSACAFAFGRLDRCADHSHAFGPEDLIEGVAELRVAVVDEEPERLLLTQLHDEVASLLGDPVSVRVRRAGDVLDPPCRERDEEQDVDRCRNAVSTVRKSQASMLAACARRNDRQDEGSRSGAGSRPAASSTLRTDAAEAAIPTPLSSPTIRRYPQCGFSRASRRISVRSDDSIGGRPGFLWGYVQRRATSWRCQRSSVSGLTGKPVQAGRGSERLSAASSARSARVSLGRAACRRRTASSCRRTRISNSFERRGRASNHTSANRFRTTRYTNDQSKQPSLDHDRSGEPNGPDAPTSRGRVCEAYAHRALALLSPGGSDKRNQPAANTIERHDLLGGLIHEYRAAA